MANRYQREIEEILDKVNEDQPAESGKGGRPRQRREANASRPRPRQAPRFNLNFSPGRLLIIGVALLFSSLMFLSILPELAAPAAWVGIGLFIVAYVLLFVKPRRTVDKRWRGQIIEDDPEPNALLRFWRWVSRG
jgi:hypothetical protein